MYGKCELNIFAFPLQSLGKKAAMNDVLLGVSRCTRDFTSNEFRLGLDEPVVSFKTIIPHMRITSINHK
jgi:hypothetical protein